MEPRLIFINLLVKLGVAAAVSSSLVRSVEFKSLLFRDERTLRQKIYLVLWFGLPIMVGVWIRFSARSFVAGDLSFETALLLGVIGGRWAGALGGILVGMPALLHGAGEGRHLVIFTIHRSQHLSPDSAQSAAAATVRLADHVFRHDCRAAFRADRVVALLSAVHFQPGQ